MKKKTKTNLKFGTKKRRLSPGIKENDLWVIKQRKLKDFREKRVRIINKDSPYYNQLGFIIDDYTVLLDNGTPISLNKKDIISDYYYFMPLQETKEEIKDKAPESLIEFLKSVFEKGLFGKKEKSKMELLIQEHKENVKKVLSQKFLIAFKVLVDSEYTKDYGTMYYPYEKQEFYKTILFYYNFLDVKQGNEGRTPIMMVINSKRIAKLDNEGNNAQEIRIQLIKMLLDLGANLEVKDNQGNSALTYAYLYNKDSDLYKFILKKSKEQLLEIVNNGKNVEIPEKSSAYYSAKKKRKNESFYLIEKEKKKYF